MEFKSERLIFRPVTESDLGKVHALHLMPETDRYNTLGIPSSTEETKLILKDWITKAESLPPERYTFYIETAAGDFAGLLGLKMGKKNYRTAEIWYKFHPDVWNQGYATEATKHILKFCFEDLGLHRVEAGCSKENAASGKVLEKSGFLLEGLKRKILPIRGEWHDGYFFAILEEDYTTRIHESNC